MFNKIRIVLVNTTEAGNIGGVARAMKNMALSKLYLINPHNFPSSTATARASSADDILAKAVICTNLKEALNGVNLVVASSARQRHNKHLQFNVVNSCEKIKQQITAGSEVAVVFGTENSGLSNAQLDMADILMTIPTSKNYSSLNLASSVQVFSYQNFISNYDMNFDNKQQKLAEFSQLENFYHHLQQVLIHIDYFDNNRPIELLMRRLRRLFAKTQINADELVILRGILAKIKKYEN